MKDVSALLTRMFQMRAEQVAHNLFAVAGGIVTVVTLVAMLASTGLRHWVKDHPYWVFGGFVAAIVTILVLLNIIQVINAKYVALRSLQRPDDLQLNDQDRHALDAFLAHMPPGGVVVKWLKHSFIPSSIPLEKFDALNEASQYLTQNLAAFADPAVSARYLELAAAIDLLRDNLQRWTSLEAGNIQRIIPIEWEQGTKYRRAVDEILEARASLIVSYEEFLRSCYQRGTQPG